MTEIPFDEQTSRDWDWFAVDGKGDIGHFATASFRLLPSSVRADWERAEDLIAFFEGIPESSDFEVRAEFWGSDFAATKERSLSNDAGREWYFRYFVKMAKGGLYSYDTALVAPGDYFGITIPKSPLKISMVPDTIRQYLTQTRSTVLFSETFRITEDVTLHW